MWYVFYLYVEYDDVFVQYFVVQQVVQYGVWYVVGVGCYVDVGVFDLMWVVVIQVVEEGIEWYCVLMQFVEQQVVVFVLGVEQCEYGQVEYQWELVVVEDFGVVGRKEGEVDDDEVGQEDVCLLLVLFLQVVYYDEGEYGVDYYGQCYCDIVYGCQI